MGMRRIKKEIKGEKESRVLIEGEPEEDGASKRGNFNPHRYLPSIALLPGRLDLRLPRTL